LNQAQISSALKQSRQSHKVVRGDTLSGISKRYQVSMSAIKRANKMKSNKLYLGKVINIPRS